MTDSGAPIWIKLTECEWGVIDGEGNLVAELETEEECVECVQDLLDDPYWGDKGPYDIIQI